MKKWSEFLSLRERCWPGYKSVPGKKTYSPGSCVKEEWSQKYKSSIDCNNPKGFSQKAHCAGKKKDESISEQHREKGRFHPVKPHNVPNVANASPRPSSDSANVKLKEDLRKWFSKTDPAGDWKRINSKGEAIGPCAREPGEPKPKCMSRAKRESLTKKERASAVRAKRKHDPNPERKGEPINVSNFGKGKISEDMENLDEKNVPTSPEKWAQAKSQAKAKFDVYPSAYANGWAAKKYKEMGGGWKSVSEAVKDKYDEGEYDQEGDMAKSDLRSIIANAKKMHDMIKDDDNLPEWVQSKITKAEDYISTVANYMAAEMSEETKLQESGGPVVYKKGDDHIEKYGEDSFALYKDGKKAKYYTSIEAAKEAMNEDVSKMPTNKLQKHFDSHKDEQRPSPAFAFKLKQVGKELAKRKAMKKEEVEQIDEISKKTLGSYVNKASSNIADKSAEAQHKRTKAAVNYDDNIRRGMSKKGADTHLNRGYDSAKPDINKVNSRMQGVQKAISRLAKEDVEQVDEISQDLAGKYLEKVTHDQLKRDGMKPNMYGRLEPKRQKGVDRALDRLSVKEASDNGGTIPTPAAETLTVNGQPKLSKTVGQTKMIPFVHEAKETKPPFDGPYTTTKAVIKDKSGAKHTPMSRARDLARKAMARNMKEQSNVTVSESRQLEIVREAMKVAKKKKEVTEAGTDKFFTDPELASQITKS